MPRKCRTNDERNTTPQEVRERIGWSKQPADEETEILRRLVETSYSTLGILKLGIEDMTKGELGNKGIWRDYLGQAAAAHQETKELLHEMIATAYEQAGSIMSQRDLAYYTELSPSTVHRIIANTKENGGNQKESS